MPGQAIITIGEKQWTASLATTVAELAQGLSGVASIPENTGVLFDMGRDYDSIDIYMAEMLFDLDIIFISSEQGVVGVLRAQTSEDEPSFNANGLGARYFLEVNAGEAEGVEVGDGVAIQRDTRQATVISQFWGAIGLAVVSAVVGATVTKVVIGRRGE